MDRPTLFVRNRHELKRICKGLKQKRCPNCGRVGTLNVHDKLDGNDPTATDKKIQRGRRAYCSNRGRRGGCGRTVAILFARVLPRHSLSAPLVGQVLDGLSEGLSTQQAWARSGLRSPLETARSLLRRVKLRLDALRTVLCDEDDPPLSEQESPLLQTIEHLRSLFPRPSCAVSEFQLRFQRPFMG